MNKQTERLINEIYNKLFKKFFTKQRLTQAADGQMQQIVLQLAQLQTSTQFNEFAKKFAKKLSAMGLTKQRGLWRKYYEAAKAKHYVSLPETYNKFQLQMMEKAVEKNFTMIKSIPQHILSVYQQKAVTDVIQQVAVGSVGRKTFEKTLKAHGAKNARLIARTESAKLQTAIDESRATTLGSKCYMWMSSNDKRTRPSHKAMDGVIVFWRADNQKPLLDNMRGNAGEFPNCRCNPNPILDENDLMNASYKVYDYKNDKIVTMTKKKLIDVLKKGEL